MRRPPPGSTRTYTPFPYTTLFRSWLDRGELDKIIERSEAVMPIQSRGDSQPPRGRSGHYDGDRHGLGHHGPKRRRGFLSDLFDRSEEHTSELQSLMRRPYAVLCLIKKKKHTYRKITIIHYNP